MITCRNCQNKELPGALYCSECGERLTPTTSGSSQDHTPRRPSRPQGPIYAGPPESSPPPQAPGRSSASRPSASQDFPGEDQRDFVSPPPAHGEHPPQTKPEYEAPPAPPKRDVSRPEESDFESPPPSPRNYPQVERPAQRSSLENVNKPQAPRASSRPYEEAPKRQTQPPPSQRTSRQTQPARVALRVIHHPEEIPLLGKTEFTLGRVNEGQPIIPDIDLSVYNAYDNGVSRLHATIHTEPQVTVTDLGSINGTRINGNKTQPHTPAILHDGDTLALGRLKLRVIIRNA